MGERLISTLWKAAQPLVEVEAQIERDCWLDIQPRVHLIIFRDGTELKRCLGDAGNLEVATGR